MATQINYYGVPPSQQMLIENRYLYTATAGQTTFNAQYGANYNLDVYYNGSRIEDYTATDNAHVVLNTPAVAGALVRIVARPLVPSNVAYVPYSGAIMTGPMTLFGGDTAHTPAAGDNSLLIANAQFVQMTNSAVEGTIKNFKSAAPGVNSYTTTITADEVVLRNGSNLYMTVRNVNLTLNANGTVGAPLSVMQARAASTWYYRWFWYNTTNGLTATLDISSTAPTAPTGYTSTDYKCRLPGASRTDGSASQYLLQIETEQKKSQYVVTSGSNTTLLPVMASGTLGTYSETTPTWAAVAWANFAPVTAIGLSVAANNSPTAGTAYHVIIAPNNSYGGRGSSAFPPLAMGIGAGYISYLTLFLESANIYACSDGSVTVSALSWEEA